MAKPDHYLKLWIILLCRAFYADGHTLRRGQLLTSNPELQVAGGHWSGSRRTNLTEGEVRSALDYFVAEGMIETRRVTRGIIITINNYDRYQDPQNYVSGGAAGDVRGNNRDNGRENNHDCSLTNCNNDGKLRDGEAGQRAGEHAGHGRGNSGGTNERIKKEKKKKPLPVKTTPAGFTLFFDWWRYAFSTLEDDRYIFDGGKDGKCLSDMLKAVGDWKELVCRACHYLTDSNRFPAGRPTLSGLKLSINRYAGSINGKEAGYYRTIGIIPPDGLALENWQPWKTEESRLKT